MRYGSPILVLIRALFLQHIVPIQIFKLIFKGMKNSYYIRKTTLRRVQFMQIKENKFSLITYPYNMKNKNKNFKNQVAGNRT